MVTRMPAIVTTIISSISVKPASPDCLPVPIFRSIGRSIFGQRVHVEDVLFAPALRVGRVLVAAEPPLGRSRERIHRNTTQIPSNRFRLADARFATAQLHLEQGLQTLGIAGDAGD